MKKRAFRIQYSLVVNGEEYPRTIDLVAVSPDSANQMLKDMVKKDHESEVIISDTTPL